MSILDYLKDYRVVRVQLPLLDGKLLGLDGVAKLTETPRFEVTFLPDQLNLDQLDMRGFCRVTYDVVGVDKTLKARIDSSLSDVKLLLEMVDTFAFVQKREYFRVDADLSVSYWLADSENPQARSVQTPVNISGGGMRFPVPETFAPGTRVGLEVVIDSPLPAVVECVAEVVGTHDLGGEKQMALKYVDIEEEGQDAIIAYCLAEQRKQLRLKVKVMGQVV